MKILSPAGIPILDLSAWMSAIVIIMLAYGISLMLLLIWSNLVVLCDTLLLWLCMGLALLIAISPWGRPFIATSQLENAQVILGLLALLLVVLIARRFARPSSARGKVCENDSLLARYHWVVPSFAWLLLLAPAFCPPMNYDVLEYHLGGVPHWFHEGVFRPMPNVFYSAQPLATESLYWAAAKFEGTPWGYSPGIVQWLFVGLSIALLARVLRVVQCPTAWITPLVLLFLVHPVIFPLALDRMTDLTGAMFMLAGLLAIFSTAPQEINSVRDLAIGLFIGAAIASKWTNAGTSALILFLAAIGDYWIRPISFLRRARCIAVIALGSLLTLGPWLIWNFMHNGNLFAPFLAAWFPTEAWGAKQLEFLIQQHDPLSPMSPRYWLNLYRRLASLQLGPPILLGTLLLALIARIRPRRISPYLGIAVGIVFACLLWGRLGHAATRFLTPVFAASVVMLGAVAGRAWPKFATREKVVTTSILLLVLAAYGSLSPGFRDLPNYWSVALGRTPPREMRDATQNFFDAVNALPKDARVMAIGEARSYYFTHPVALASVFDQHPIRNSVETANSSDEIISNLRDEGFTHIAVNEYELARLLQFHPALELMNTSEFQTYRAEGPPAWPALLASYSGWAEFASDPLTAEQRDRYVQFLNQLKSQATWIEPRGGALTFWIAPLSPPASSP